MSSRRLLLFAALPTLALACATTANYRVEASVRSLRAGSHDASGIAKVSGADVALQCPDASASRELGKTDSDGALRIDGNGVIPLACTIAISEAGYRTSMLAVADACTEKSMGGCRTLALTAMLTPEPTAQQ